MFRKTPQTLLVRNLLLKKGHATNQQLAVEARKTFPDITNTTVHRITARLINAKLATYAPSLDHVKVIDANLKKHDHFLCRGCNKLLDIALGDEIFNNLQQQLPAPLSRHNILIAGTCVKCARK
jgi:Fur family peroxide stress response transcriptional regulator